MTIIKLRVSDFKKIIERLSIVFEEQKDYLNDLDTKLGDGDHGLSMSRGFSAMNSYLKERPNLTIQSLLTEGGMHFNEITGSTIGILIFSAMRAAGRVAIDKESVDLITLTIMLEEAIKAIKKRGKADVGQKTMLDSLVPAINTLQDGLKSHQESEYKIIQDTIKSAFDGAESTKKMKSSIGRAKWFVNRSIGVLDPGALSGYLIIKTFGEYIIENL